MIVNYKSRLASIIQPLKREKSFFALDEIHSHLNAIQNAVEAIPNTTITTKTVTQTKNTVQSSILSINGLPLLPKGSLITSDGSIDLAFPIGVDGQSIIADSTEISGLRWGASSIGGINKQLGTSYTIVSSDAGKLITLNNASPVAVTLNPLSSTFFCGLENLGVGLVTITPSIGTIDGASSLTLIQYQGVLLYCDGSNYFTSRGRDSIMIGDSGSGGLSGNVPSPGAGDTTLKKFLMADATWEIPPVFVGDSGSGGVKGYVPTPAMGDATKYLRGDATWQTLLSILLQTNSVNNGSQSKLNLIPGSNVTIVDGGSGNVTIAATSGGGSGGLTSLSFNSSTTAIFGGNWWGSVSTIAPGANKVLHIRLAATRISTSYSIAIGFSSDATNGYYFIAQSDGNLVNYYYNGSSHSINASGVVDNDVGPVLLDFYISITATGTHGISLGGFMNSTNSANRSWPSFVRNTQIDMTGTLTVYVVMDAIASLHSCTYEIL